MKVRVRVSFEVEIEVDGDPARDDLSFDIEDNHCPGTGLVGNAVQDLIERNIGSDSCLMCPHGKNEIISVDGVPWAKTAFPSQ